MKICLYSILLFLSLHNFQVNSLKLNTRPIIGILTQELSPKFQQKYPGKTSHIAASYVKFVEGAGARAIPIFIGKTQKYYENILSKINGVLFPGGARYFNTSNGYKDAGEKIYEIVTKMNDNGIYMPIWGICLGFELLTYLSINNKEHRTFCNAVDLSSSLNFTKDFDKSKLFKNIPVNIKNTLQYKKATTNFHIYCITKSNFTAYGLNDLWNILSTSYDENNLEYISVIEHKTYPIYGVQFHPEKNIYEFVKKNIDHSPDAIAASQHLANFFVNECRKNNNSFNSAIEEEKYLMYNYCPEYTGRNSGTFQQVYYFDD